MTSDQQQQMHLTIGRALLHHLGAGEENIFEIVNQFNAALASIKPDEKAQLAQLNLQAGLKARDASAFEPALKYFLRWYVTVAGRPLANAV